MSVDTILIICSMLKERQMITSKENNGSIKRMRKTDQDSL